MKFVIYQDVTGAWRWSLVSANGQIMGDSSESYVEKTNVGDAIQTIVDNIQSGNFSVNSRDE